MLVIKSRQLHGQRSLVCPRLIRHAGFVHASRTPAEGLTEQISFTSDRRGVWGKAPPLSWQTIGWSWKEASSWFPWQKSQWDFSITFWIIEKKKHCGAQHFMILTCFIQLNLDHFCELGYKETHTKVVYFLHHHYAKGGPFFQSTLDKISLY